MISAEKWVWETPLRFVKPKPQSFRILPSFLCDNPARLEKWPLCQADHGWRVRRSEPDGPCSDGASKSRAGNCAGRKCRESLNASASWWHWERQHPAARRNHTGAETDDPPSFGSNLEGAPALIGEIQVDAFLTRSVGCGRRVSGASNTARTSSRSSVDLIASALAGSPVCS
jgi:hypothetical protein